MIELIAFFLAGSFSIGYGAARVGFPAVQQFDALKKIGAGFAFGLVFFGISAVLTLLSGNNGTYFLIVAFITGISFVGLFAKRIFLGETDMEIIQPKKEHARAPDAAQTETGPEESALSTRPAITFEQGLMIKTKGEGEKAGARVFKEKESNILRKLNETTKGIEEADLEKKKKEALEKLRKSARQI
ncbi:Uncharacterised protein [uncultured archaeon]|nr:Uncharacterised protein [uncultured archaeon]